MSTHAQILANGETLNYFEAGTASASKQPTLLFIHGNFSSWQWWAETINVLAKYDYHILAVDLRGFGQSSYQQQCHCFKDWAGDLVDFCRLKGVKECVAIGWSFGGGVAMKLAELAPQLVRKIVLTCSVSHEGLTLFNGKEACRTYEQLRENAKILFMESIIGTGNRQAFKQVFQSVLLTHAKEYPAAKYEPMLEGSMKQKCYIDVIFALANPDIAITAVKSEVLMVHGKCDNVVTLQSVVATGQHFKNFVVWENNAHMIPIENILGYAELVRKFIEGK